MCERMEEDWLVKRIIGSDVRDMRFRGRPQTGWMDDVKSVEYRGISVEQ